MGARRNRVTVATIKLWQHEVGAVAGTMSAGWAASNTRPLSRRRACRSRRSRCPCRPGRAVPLEVAELARLAAAILHDREALSANLRHDDSRAVDQIFRVGASAGGARAKAVVAWNPATGEVRSGQVPALAGFEPWILKFDGVHDTALGDPRGYGRVEYAYNRDDHTRNIAFLMDRAGRWRQAPAFDVVWAHNPAGRWTDRHQLSIGGKREDITRADLLELAARMGLDDAPGIIDEVAAAVARWREFADEASVPGDLARHIGGVIAG